MPVLTLFAALAQSFAVVPAHELPVLHDAPVRAATIACNPDPSKNKGCFREADPAARRAAVASKPKASSVMVACHPDPSKNRGCLRPSYDRQPAEALALTETDLRAR
ncbi:hypothetical protein [Novosphingobium sp.]|uniref:hypothetical protein n=1 Tax=Novosphingobium sp. TaxID=1874826 RepID=UPI0038BC46D6